ncbi:hypothetical protein L3X39_04020 [Sabulilitoribacter multivorans]|uniref:NlpE N-terminal domain-containing protein n=1 Tax=Flaviramulus multivorans TaxID=1304750 RepID=A0ABS9IHD6_9FLAO|nr:hypothetical protein [Flaviramulus multivorans]MCF7559793.1 hypothetical protein [Flaviramulus multivorans]
MKKLLILFLCTSVLVGCKNDTKSKKEETPVSPENSERTEKQSDGLTLLKGAFIYHGDAAVLQTHAEIYGVFVTDKMLELNKMAEQYKKQPTDMVQIEIRGKITNQKDEKILWENKVEIVEILSVSAPKDKDNVIKLGQ